jgi:undecaprenyl-diphosphatase
MEMYEGIVLGVLQGLTEFLPVSSSGHLVLGQIFFGITESQLIFDISLHVGTLLAILVVYFSDIRSLLASVFGFLSKALSGKPFRHLFKADPHLRIAGLILVGSFPTAVIGLFIKQYEAVLFSSASLVGFMLILTGIILWVSRNYYTAEPIGDGFSIKKAVFIGTVQGLAVLPGISRSGSTIAAGMMAGLDRDTAARFSFLLSVPAVMGAEVLGLKDIMEQGLSIDLVTIYGTIAAFITGLIALKLLLHLVHAGRFHLFAPYCWLAGAAALLSTVI